MHQLVKSLMLFNFIRLFLIKQLKSRSTSKIYYSFIIYLYLYFLNSTNLCWRRIALSKLLHTKFLFMKLDLTKKAAAAYKRLFHRLKRIFKFRRHVRYSRYLLWQHKKVYSIKRKNRYRRLPKMFNLLPYFINFKKYAILAQMVVIAGNVISTRGMNFLLFGFNKNIFFMFFNSYTFSVKMLKILRKSQILCTIKATPTNVYLTVINGCGEVKLSYSAGQVGFTKRKTRRKFSVFEKMIESLVLKLGRNSAFKIDRLSFFNIPKFIIYKVIAEFVSREVTVSKIWFYTKSSHSNFDKFKFKKLRRI